MSDSTDHAPLVTPPPHRPSLPAPPAPQSSGPGWVGRVVPIVATVALTVAAMLFWQRLGHKPQPEAPPPPPPMPVQVRAVQPENVPTFPRFLGQAEGSQIVNVRARVSGYLTERTFKEGELVKKGQALFQIDARPFAASLNIAKAKLVSAQATQAQAQSQLKRYKDLLDKGSATSGEYEEIEKEERVAGASVEEQKANVESAALQLEYTTIKAEQAGLVGRALKYVGDYVDSSAGAEVAVIQAADPIFVKFSVTEQDILRTQQRIADGQLKSPPINQIRFKLTLSDGSDYPQIATLNYADVEIDNSTGSGVIRGAVPNAANKLKPGMFVYATILDQELVGVLRVPQAAVTQSPAGASVMLMNDKDVVEVRPVKLGEWSGDEWIIAGGLKPGDRVITDRIPMLRPGASVTVAPASQPAAQAQPKQP